MACTSRYALPKSHLRVGCHCPRQPLFSSAYPLMNFPAWPGQSSVQPMFVKKSALSIFPRRTHNGTNLRCQFFPLVAWLPLPQCPDQQSSSSSLGLSSPEISRTLPNHVPASTTSCPKRGSGGANLSDMGLNLSGSWQQCHSASSNTPSRI